MQLKVPFGKLVIPLLISSLIISCKKDDPAVPGSEKSVLTFKIDTISGEINQSQHTISISVPAEYDLTKAVPVVTVSSKATVTPVAGATVDLTNPVTYTVMAEDKTTQTYTVTATHRIGTGNRIIEATATPVGYGPLKLNGVIDDINHTVTFDVSFDLHDDMKNVGVTVKVSSGASVSPALVDTFDLSTNPVTYRVIAANGAVQEYTIRARNTDGKIIGSDIALHSTTVNLYRFGIVSYKGDSTRYYTEDAKGIETDYFMLFYATEGEDLSYLPLKSTRLSPGATISPAIDIPQDFSHDVRYTVTSASGATKVYTVRVVRRKIVGTNEGAKYAATTNIFNTGGFIFYFGDGLITGASLINNVTKAEVPCTITSDPKYSWGYYSTSFKPLAGTTFPQGDYTLKVKLADGTDYLTRDRMIVRQ